MIGARLTPWSWWARRPEAVPDFTPTVLAVGVKFQIVTLLAVRRPNVLPSAEGVGYTCFDRNPAELQEGWRIPLW